MSKRDENLLIRGARRAVDNTQRQVDKLRGPAAWAREKAVSVLGPRVNQQVETWLRSLAEPENAQRIQSAFASVAQVGMELGFRADPDAAQLYQFVTWLEERHGSTPVLLRVAEHAASAESGFRKTIEASLVGLSQPHGSEARRESARQMHELRDVISSDLLDLLCGLAAIGGDEDVPSGIEARVAFFEDANLPEDFRHLAARAAGLPGAFESLESAIAEDRPEGGGLTKFVPSFDDPHLRFLTLSQLFFVHSYLTRNLIERLPELLAQTQQDDR